jgi:hypothetical protein
MQKIIFKNIITVVRIEAFLDPIKFVAKLALIAPIKGNSIINSNMIL